MAGIIKVSNMPEILALADDGYLYAIKNGESKKIRKDNLMSGFLTSGYQSVADADTVFTNGWYSLPASLGAGNSPIVGVSGTLLVVNGGDDNTYATQLWIRSDNSATQRMAFRSWDGSDWNDWVFLLDTEYLVKADTPTAVAGVDDNDYMTALKTKQAIEDNQTSSMTGAVMPFAMATPPSGWLLCDGSAVSRTTYADLFSRLGTTWGVGDGATTFNLPDLRGEFIRGLDSGRGVDTGRTLGSSQDGTGFTEYYLNAGHWPYVDVTTGTGDDETDVSESSFGGFQANVGSSSYTKKTLTTRPRNQALLMCIKT